MFGSTPSTQSNVEPIQRQVIGQLGDYFSGLIGSQPAGIGQIGDILKGKSGFLNDLYSTLSTNAVDTATRNFKRTTAPGISSYFSGVGGSLSTRRDKSLADALGNAQADAQGRVTDMLPSLINLQFQGIGQQQQLGLNQYNQFLQYALSGTRGGANTTNNAGSEIAGGIGSLAGIAAAALLL